jgi:hypothetical protein
MHRAVGDRPDNIWTGTLFGVSEQLDQAAQEKNRNGAGDGSIAGPRKAVALVRR